MTERQQITVQSRPLFALGKRCRRNTTTTVARAPNSIRTTLLLRAEQNRSGRGRPAICDGISGWKREVRQKAPMERNWSLRSGLSFLKNSDQADERVPFWSGRWPCGRMRSCPARFSARPPEIDIRAGRLHFENVARLGHIYLRALDGVASNVPSCDSDKEMLRRSVERHG